MAKLFNAREICVLSLRKIGAVAQQDASTPAGGLIDIALQHLDLILAEKSGTTRLWFLSPQELTFNYAKDSESVDMSSLVGANNRLDMVRAAYNDDTDDEITLLTRDQFNIIKNGGALDFASGRTLYIGPDGDDTYTAYLRPVPTEDITIRVTGTKLAPSVALATGTSSTAAHGFETAWQRWMVNALAADIGDGPIARLPEQRLDRWVAIADAAWVKLNSYRGGGERKAVRFTRAWGG